MREFLKALALILIGVCAQAKPVCADLFMHVFIEPGSATQNDLEAKKTLSRLYEQAGVLGLANPDHEHPTAFTILTNLIARHGTDPRLKTISVELSSELREYLEIASTREPSAEESAAAGPWLAYLSQQPEPRFIIDHVLPAVRAINAHRAKDPLLLTPVDSVTMKHMMNFDMAFISSIDREIGTAQNFETLVLNRWPTRKHVVIYQHAHLLKNLTADGSLNGARVNAPLAWADMLTKRNAAFAREYKVVLLDQKSKFNPSGAIDTNSPSLKLQADGFLGTYRNGSVHRTAADKTIADAIVIMNP